MDQWWKEKLECYEGKVWLLVITPAVVLKCVAVPAVAAIVVLPLGHKQVYVSLTTVAPYPGIRKYP